MASGWGCRDIRKNQIGIGGQKNMRTRNITLPEVGISTFGVNSRVGGHAGVAGLGEISNGWNILPGLDNANRAIPTNAATRSLGLDFSNALNEALDKHGVEAQVQNDGVISQFHIEMLGSLMLQPGVGAAFPKQIAELAFRMFTDGEFQKEVILKLIQENGIADLVSRLKFVGVTLKPGPQVAQPSQKKSKLGLGLVIAGGGLLFALTRNRNR